MPRMFPERKHAWIEALNFQWFRRGIGCYPDRCCHPILHASLLQNGLIVFTNGR